MHVVSYNHNYNVQIITSILYTEEIYIHTYTVESLLSGPLLNDHHLFNGQSLKSQNIRNIITVLGVYQLIEDRVASIPE